MRDIIKSHQLKLGYEFYNKMLPVDTQNLFILDSVIHEHQTRHSKYLLHIPEIQTFTLLVKCPFRHSFCTNTKSRPPGRGTGVTRIGAKLLGAALGVPVFKKSVT